MLQVVFNVNQQITDIRVIRGLPDGLTEKAIEAAKKIRFNPAVKNGAPVSVRGVLNSHSTSTKCGDQTVTGDNNGKRRRHTPPLPI